MAVALRDPVFASAQPRPRLTRAEVDLLDDAQVQDLHARVLESNRRRDSAIRIGALRTHFAAVAASLGHAEPQLSDAWLCGGCGQLNAHPWDTERYQLTPCTHCRTVLPTTTTEDP
jgi:hypothetical protein